MTKTLAQKLYIRPGYTVALLNAPKGAADLLVPLPEEVTVVTNLKGKSDLALCFIKSVADLEKSVKEIKSITDDETVLWFAYPKQSSKTKTDLTRDRGWNILYDAGFVGVASVAIDTTWSALRFKRALATGQEEIVSKQYAGERATLLPLFHALRNTITNLGPDIQITARQSYVAFSRRTQFALLMPAKERLDLVLKLPRAPIVERLIPAQGVGSGSMTHRVPITALSDIDHEVIQWLQEAYRATNL